MDINQDLNRALVEFFEGMAAWEHQLVEGSGLLLPVMHTLELLGLYGPMRMTDLAHKLSISTGTLTARIDRMEKDGLVTRIANPEDRRSLLIALTEQGEVHFSTHDKAHLHLTEDLIAAFSADDKQNLLGMLEKMNRHFRNPE